MATCIIPAKIMYPFTQNLEASYFFPQELHFSRESQVGFFNPQPMPDHSGSQEVKLMSRNHSTSFSPFSKFHMSRTDSVESEEQPEPHILKEQKSIFGLEHHVEPKRGTGISSDCVKVDNHDSKFWSYLLNQSAFAFMEPEHQSGSLYDDDLLSRSLSDMLSKKLKLLASNVPLHQPPNKNNLKLEEEEPFESMEGIEDQTIGNLLHDDDDLLSGVIDEKGFVGQPNRGYKSDDKFCSSGCIEFQGDNIYDSHAPQFAAKGLSYGQQGGLDGTIVGENSFGEHPSRTLFVRNISSNTGESELRVLFEQYGDIWMIYTACKDRVFAMISYYDTRAAENAIRSLQNRIFKHQKLDIRFSNPKGYLSENDINQGIVAVSNDSSVSNDDLSQIFGVYGEIKKIFSTPHKSHQRFVEFYDIRAAEAALQALNKNEIGGKKFELEPRCPGAARCSMEQPYPEAEQEDTNGWKQGSVSLGNGIEHGAIHSLHSLICAAMSPLMDPTDHGISCTVPQSLSFASKSNQSSLVDLSHSLRQTNFGFKGTPGFHPESVPEFHNAQTNGVSYNSSNKEFAMDMYMNSKSAEGTENRCLCEVGFGSLNNHYFGNNGGFGVSGDGSSQFHGSYIWNDSNKFHQQPSAPLLWSSSYSFTSNGPGHLPAQRRVISGATSQMLNAVLPSCHAGSSPPINHPLWDMQNSYAGDFTHQGNFQSGSSEGMGFSGSPRRCSLGLSSSRGIFPHATGNCMNSCACSSHTATPLPQSKCHSQLFHARNPMIPVPGLVDTPSDRIKSRRNDAKSNQADNKKQHELDIEQIMRGEDTRTTLMIKNIPNKYTSKMLVAAIDEKHRGTYDFIYLPIDFKNKCNVGYAFINMTKAEHILPFYQSFNGKKWEKFNSEKVTSLAYARIQGKAALIAHFQNSSLMNEDKRFRPILFYSDGPNAGEPEPFPVGVKIRSRSRRSRTTTSGGEDNRQASSTAAYSNVETCCNAAGSGSASKSADHVPCPVSK